MARTYSHTHDPHHAFEADTIKGFTPAEIDAAIEKADALPEITSEDEGKVLSVDAEGKLFYGDALPQATLKRTYDDGTALETNHAALSFENNEIFDKCAYSGFPFTILIALANVNAYSSGLILSLGGDIHELFIFDSSGIIAVTITPSDIVEYNDKKYIKIKRKDELGDPTKGKLIYPLPAYPTTVEPTKYFLGLNDSGDYVKWRKIETNVQVESDAALETQWDTLESAVIAATGSTKGDEAIFSTPFPNAYVAMMTAFGNSVINGIACSFKIGSRVALILSNDNVKQSALFTYSTKGSNGKTYIINSCVGQSEITLTSKLIYDGN